MVCSGIDLNLRLGSLEVRVVCGAFCLGGGSWVREFWYMEVPSCTEWKINSAMVSFNPNCYVEVGKEGVDAKVKALSMYRGVMRPYPHPRSAEFIEGLAAYRGGQWGLLRGYGDRRKEASFASESIDHIKTKKSNKNTEND